MIGWELEYSPEEGTPAAMIKPQIPPDIKLQRYNSIMAAQKSVSMMNNQKLKGKLLRVLAERYDPVNKMYIGRSEKDAHNVDGVVFFKGAKCIPGNFYTVKIIKTREYDLIGEAVETSF